MARVARFRTGLGLVLLGLLTGAARADEAPEAEMKAAFLYNFAKFVAWPDATIAADGQGFLLCYDGGRELGKALKGLEGKAVGTAVILVRHVTSAAEIDGCRLLHLEAAWTAGLPEERVSRRGLLTVGNGEGFAETGGIIGFYRANLTLRFIINVDAASRAGLKIDAKLLNLARVVRGS